MGGHICLWGSWGRGMSDVGCVEGWLPCCTAGGLRRLFDRMIEGVW